jgi:hypothetical protein
MLSFLSFSLCLLFCSSPSFLLSFQVLACVTCCEFRSVLSLLMLQYTCTHQLISCSVLMEFIDEIGRSGSACDVYSGGALFEYQLVHWLTWFRFLLCFLSPSIQVPVNYLKLGHNRFLPYPFQFIFHSLPVVRNLYYAILHLSIPLHQYITYTQHNSVNSATISITPSHRYMFRPQTTIVRCFSYVETVPLYIMSTYSHYM